MPDSKVASELGFAQANLDRAAVKRTDQAWLAQRLDDPASRFIRFIGDRPIIDVSGADLLPARFTRQQAHDAGNGTEPVLLGLDGAGAALFATQSAPAGDDSDLSTVHKLIDLRSLALQGVLAPPELGLLAQARSLLNWHERHGFCANCGAGTKPVEGGYRRNCAACGAAHFPRTDPVVIMVIIHNNQCLLGRSHNFAGGVYSALAGFMEPGETMEDAARREIHEESGIRVGKVDYLLSQPWPFPSSLMIGLIGEGLNSDITIDQQELEDARWFGAPEITAMLAGRHADGLKTPQPMAIAYHILIEALKRMA